MNATELFATITRRSMKIVVVGDVMIDAYLWGKAERISPEAPVPVVAVQRREQRLGGAANVALNLRALGVEPLLCAVVGADEAGETLRQLLREQGMRTEGILTDPSRPTTIKHRILAGTQHLLRVDDESTAELTPAIAEALLERVNHFAEQCDALIFEDYDKGVLSQSLIRPIIARARVRGLPTVVDPKKRNFLAYSGATLFKPNLKELREGLPMQLTMPPDAQTQAQIAAARERLQTDCLLVTLSEHGILAACPEQVWHIPAHKREIADVSGAGDTVISVAATMLALQLPTPTIAALSNLAGGLVCEYPGVAPLPKDRFIQEIDKLAIRF
ncbi:MAG: bifunctional heptose 7-phosphate kinase/heptose 1-phosphate adenyltransferase [Bernardetiaceae bacterium]